MLHLTPQLFRVVNKRNGEDLPDPEVTTLKNGSQVLNFLVAPVDGRDDEASTFINVGLWGRKGEQLSGYVQHGDEFLFGGAMKVTPDDDNPKIHYYQLNVNTGGPLSRVSRTRFVPAEVSEEMEGDLAAAKSAAKKAETRTQADDDDDIPF